MDEFRATAGGELTQKQFADAVGEVLWSRSSSTEYVSKGTINVFIVIVILGIQVAQTSLFWSQRKHGPRWFVPWSCLPHVYNYSRPPPPGVIMDTSVQDEANSPARETVGASRPKPDVELGDPTSPTDEQNNNNPPASPVNIDCVICMSEVKFFNYDEA